MFPIGLSILKVLDLGNIFTYIVYTIIYIIVIDYIPNFVGIIALFICILVFIASFVFILKKDRTDEVRVLDDNNSTAKFGIKYNNQTSTNGKLNITINETSSIKDTIPNIEITEILDSSSYSEQETFTISVKAVAPYEKDLITEVFTYSMKHRLGIQLDYNKYSIVNLST